MLEPSAASAWTYVRFGPVVRRPRRLLRYRPAVRPRAAFWIVLAVIIAAGAAVAVVIATGDDGEDPGRRSAPPAANLWIDSGGGNCRRRPTPAEYGDATACKTFSAAYDAARQGDVVMVKGGTYLDPELTGLVKGSPDADEPDVTFRAAPGERVAVRDIEVLVPHVSFAGIDLLEAAFKYSSETESKRAGDITVAGSDGHSMSVTSVWGFTLRDSDLGPNQHPDQPGDETQDALFIGAYPVGDGHHPKDVEIDDVVFHDVRRPIPEAHSDCLQLTAGERVTVRRSRFYACADADIIPKNDQGPISSLLIENNMFGAVTNEVSPAVNVSDTDGQSCGQVVIRFNSFERQGIRSTDIEECDISVYGNILHALNCAGFSIDAFTYNVIETGTPDCEDGTNYRVPDGDVGYVDRDDDSTFDLSLRPGSEAVDRGDPDRWPKTDQSGDDRPIGRAPDAGADERG